MKNKHDIFLSYSRRDKERVLPIVQLLEQQGWKIWWDPKIPHGVSFSDYIEEQLDHSRIVIVVWSSHSIKSKWVKAEAVDGEERGVLMPVKIDNVQPPLIFRQIQTADFIDTTSVRYATELQHFLTSISNRLGNTISTTASSTSRFSTSNNKSPTIQQPISQNGFRDIDGTNGILTDARDGQTYKTIKIGKQIWMVENLNFEIEDSW